MAILAGLTELVDGLLYALGFLTPLAGLMIAGTVKVHGPNGLWSTENGYEYNITVLADSRGSFNRSREICYRCFFIFKYLKLKIT